MGHTTEQVVGEGKIVSVHFTLKDDQGEVLDTSDGEEPLEYLHGAANILPALEQRALGLKVGDRFEATLAPADGYGERRGNATQTLPRDVFPEGEMEPGMQFMAEGNDGELMPLWITEVTSTGVVVDANHPLAGETLHFNVEVVSIRDATADEVEHGHPHGPHGHHHHH